MAMNVPVLPIPALKIYIYTNSRTNKERYNDLEEQCSVCVTSSKIMVVLSWLIFFNGPDLK
jgi:hypothetical protein